MCICYSTRAEYICFGFCQAQGHLSLQTSNLRDDPEIQRWSNIFTHFLGAHISNNKKKPEIPSSLLSNESSFSQLSEDVPRYDI